MRCASSLLSSATLSNPGVATPGLGPLRRSGAFFCSVTPTGKKGMPAAFIFLISGTNGMSSTSIFFDPGSNGMSADIHFL